MAPLIVLSGAFIVFAGLGAAGVGLLAGWLTPLRFALACMFLLTASAHWGRRRPDLIRMVPPAFRHPEALVTATGVLELLGALGLLVPSVAPYAAAGLTLLLLAMFPANVHAARAGLSIGGRRVMGIVPRALLQVVFVSSTLVVLIASVR